MAALVARIQRELSGSLNHYLEMTELAEGIGQYIVPPGLGNMSGPLGALALAVDADLRCTHDAREAMSH